MSIHVSSNVWRSCPQQGDRLLLMLALADFANDEGYCWPSQLSLAKRVRCSERGVQRMVDALVEEGEFKLVKPGCGRGKSAVYLLERYSEGGLCTTFGKGDPGATKGDPGANKGRKLSEQGAAEHSTIHHKNTRSRAALLTDEEFWTALKDNPAYSHVDFERERGKMEAWLLTPRGRGRQLTRRFVVNWLNRLDAPLSNGTHKTTGPESGRNIGTANEGRSSQYAGVGKVL